MRVWLISVFKLVLKKIKQFFFHPRRLCSLISKIYYKIILNPIYVIIFENKKFLMHPLCPPVCNCMCFSVKTYPGALSMQAG